MPFKKDPPPPRPEDPTKPYFLFPVTTLTKADIRLEPFNKTQHATAFWNGTGPDPSIYAYLSWGPFTTQEQFINEVVVPAHEEPGKQLFAIMTSRRPKSTLTTTTNNNNTAINDDFHLAGLLGLMEASRLHLKLEIGPIIILPRYQGTGLATDAARLATDHALARQEDGGLGLRRVEWAANAATPSSVRLAERIGFRREGVIRWAMMLRSDDSSGKIGHGRAEPESGRDGEGDGEGFIGRDTVILGKCWDD